MASKNARLLVLAAVSGAILLSGCGRTSPQLAYPAKAASKSSIGAKSVSPDREFAGDLRRAQYWADDAVHVMAIHGTRGNTTKLSASCNVFYSPEAHYAGKPSVFVARHFGFSIAAQYSEIKDYNGLAGTLKPIVGYSTTAEAAWSKVKKYVPAAPAPSPAPGTMSASQQTERLMLGTTAFLTQPESGDPVWAFYSNKQRFLINATTGALGAPEPQVDPNDRLNRNREADLQRAAAIWLPMSLGQTNRQDEPSPTN